MKLEVIGIPGVILELRAGVKKLVQETADFTEERAKSYTTYRTGNARRGWQQTTNANGFSVYNTVPYIGRLDEGYSPVNPDGITRPTIRDLNKKVKK